MLNRFLLFFINEKRKFKGVENIIAERPKLITTFTILAYIHTLWNFPYSSKLNFLE
jgi:hypothetical protein